MNFRWWRKWEERKRLVMALSYSSSRCFMVRHVCSLLSTCAFRLGADVDEGRDADALGRRRIQHIDANLWLVLSRLS
jgi:hypothetical protein